MGHQFRRSPIPPASCRSISRPRVAQQNRRARFCLMAHGRHADLSQSGTAALETSRGPELSLESDLSRQHFETPSLLRPDSTASRSTSHVVGVGRSFACALQRLPLFRRLAPARRRGVAKSGAVGAAAPPGNVHLQPRLRFGDSPSAVSSTMSDRVGQFRNNRLQQRPQLRNDRVSAICGVARSPYSRPHRIALQVQPGAAGKASAIAASATLLHVPSQCAFVRHLPL